MDKILKLYKKYYEVIAYLFWGVMCTLVSFGTYAVFIRLFRGMKNASFRMFGTEFAMNIFWATALSWLCAVSFAFVTNKIRVFRSPSWAPGVVFPELFKFFGARIVTGIVEIVGVPLLVSLGMNQVLFHTEGFLAKIVINVIVIILNYVFSKLFVFRGDKEDAKADGTAC
jgi:putative flippase GtrA|uniref:Putative membrane protein n=1 Tax=Eubacterium cellulosolvens (strain ATCC 43171 / JCM 9499 / 6) TaxID=633697 RepID=I5ASQ6_EUBC6